LGIARRKKGRQPGGGRPGVARSATPQMQAEGDLHRHGVQRSVCRRAPILRRPAILSSAKGCGGRRIGAPGGACDPGPSHRRRLKPTVFAAPSLLSGQWARASRLLGPARKSVRARGGVGLVPEPQNSARAGGEPGRLSPGGGGPGLLGFRHYSQPLVELKQIPRSPENRGSWTDRSAQRSGWTARGQRGSPPPGLGACDGRRPRRDGRPGGRIARGDGGSGKLP
jgi:hypothetical protein